MKKKLIEVALPLEAINEEASRRKRKAPAGYPTTMHKWWAQRPAAAARAVIFAQIVDDPSEHSDLFKTEKAQERERQRLFKIIRDLVLWENSKNAEVLERARTEIWQSWRGTCAENADHPDAKELFNRYKLPGFYDPFTGSGALPLEAQRLGLKAFASDLNPVAILINKAMIEIPPRFVGKAPVRKVAHGQATMERPIWQGADALAEDVRYYGKWVLDQAKKRIGDLYPTIEITPEMANGRPDLVGLEGRKLTVAAWLWMRTVKSPNPAFASVDVPLASTFVLSNKSGKEVHVEPVISQGGYHFEVRMGTPKDATAAKRGTKLARGSNFQCLMSGTPIDPPYIRAEGKAGRIGVRLMAIVAEGERGRVYLSPTDAMEKAAASATADWMPEVPMPSNPRWFSPPLYGFTSWGDLFTKRQLKALTTFSDLLNLVCKHVEEDALAAGYDNGGSSLTSGGSGARAYAEAVVTYLGVVLSRMLHYGSTICTWLAKDAAIARTFTKQAIPMTWDFAEGNVFGKSSTSWEKCTEVVASAIEYLPAGAAAEVHLADATVAQKPPSALIVSTDPPYFDNIGYSELSDFFYVWLRRALGSIFPELF